MANRATLGTAAAPATRWRNCRRGNFISIPPSIVSLFDHLVSAAEQRQRNGQAKRLGSLQVQEHLDLRGLLNRQFARLFPFENTGGVDASQTVSVGKATAIAHQAAGGDELAVFEDRRHRVAERQFGELLAS